MGNKTKSKDRYRLRLLVLLVIVVSAILLVVFIINKGEKSNSNNASESRISESVTKVPNTKTDVNKLIGRWMRIDGNYAIEITAIDAEGNMKAAYYNPKPINISLAEAYKEIPLRIYVEFKDVGYEGSYYNLTYDPAEDILKGAYFQATYGQTYEVMFMKQEDQGS